MSNKTKYWAIGLAASGTGDIASFTAINSGTTPDTAMIIVTPVFSSVADCEEDIDTFLIIVDPIPVINSSANITICTGTAINYSLTSNVTGTTYSWTSSDAEGSIGGNNSGTGTSINDVLSNFGENDGIVVYEITPYGPSPSSCEAPKFYLTVKVVNCNFQLEVII